MEPASDSLSNDFKEIGQALRSLGDPHNALKGFSNSKLLEGEVVVRFALSLLITGVSAGTIHILQNAPRGPLGPEPGMIDGLLMLGSVLTVGLAANIKNACNTLLRERGISERLPVSVLFTDANMPKPLNPT